MGLHGSTLKSLFARKPDCLSLTEIGSTTGVKGVQLLLRVWGGGGVDKLFIADFSFLGQKLVLMALAGENYFSRFLFFPDFFC